MHSEEEAYRGTMTARTADGEPHTLIVTRRHAGPPARVWLTLNGAWKTTVQLTDTETAQLTELLTRALHPPSESRG
ncbi:MAG TPA: hypothetical protein VHH34_19355 [Pseudonocardiaceae bacterium]|nr:hypothetical protein [Pseudonocardiaceae bacterium]